MDSIEHDQDWAWTDKTALDLLVSGEDNLGVVSDMNWVSWARTAAAYAQCGMRLYPWGLMLSGALRRISRAV